MEAIKFSCEHFGEAPRNMGRGTARQRRLANHALRRCKSCQSDHLRNHWATIRLSVNPVVTAEEQALREVRLAADLARLDLVY